MSNYSHRRSLLGDLLLKTTLFEKSPARRTDEVEQRHPYEEQGDDGDGDDQGKNFVRHDFLRDLAGEAVKDGRLRQPKPKRGAGIS